MANEEGAPAPAPPPFPNARPLFRPPSPEAPRPLSDKARGKKRAVEVIELEDDGEEEEEEEEDELDSDDDLIVVESVPKKKIKLDAGNENGNGKGKGKTKEVVPEMLIIDSSSDNEDIYPPARAAPPKGRPNPPPVDPETALLREILNIFPDALPAYVLNHIRDPDNQHSADTIVGKMLEVDYPKAEKEVGNKNGKGKKRARGDSDDEGESEVQIDWLDTSKRKLNDDYKKAA